MLTERGILCKVNSVMIPGINDRHLVEVNKRLNRVVHSSTISCRLSPLREHGTSVWPQGQRVPRLGS